MECSYLNLPAERAVLRVQKVALLLANARNPLRRGILADINFEQVAHLGGEVVGKKYFLTGWTTNVQGASRTETSHRGYRGGSMTITGFRFNQLASRE